MLLISVPPPTCKPPCRVPPSSLRLSRACRRGGVLAGAGEASECAGGDLLRGGGRAAGLCASGTGGRARGQRAQRRSPALPLPRLWRGLHLFTTSCGCGSHPGSPAMPVRPCCWNWTVALSPRPQNSVSPHPLLGALTGRHSMDIRHPPRLLLAG